MTNNINDQVNDALDQLLIQARNKGDSEAFYKAVAEYATEDPNVEALLRQLYREHFADHLETYA